MRQLELPGGFLVPPGWIYREDFISVGEEQTLLAELGALTYSEVSMRGAIARRRVVHYGYHYGYGARRLTETEAIPAFLLPLRARAAELARVDPEGLVEALVSEYPPGAPIGWHRDAPMFGLTVGISLLSPSLMRLRRVTERGTHRYRVLLAPRSAYLLAGQARWLWQHSIPPVAALRYSISFRTLASLKAQLPRANQR